MYLHMYIYSIRYIVYGSSIWYLVNGMLCTDYIMGLEALAVSYL